MEFSIYRSRCVSDRFKYYDLDILRTSIRNNQANGITGFLHRNETHYFQYIEGEARQMRRLLGRLKDDHRHTDFEMLMDGEIDVRRFAGWSMGYSEGLREACVVQGLAIKDTAETVLNFLVRAAAQQRLKHHTADQ